MKVWVASAIGDRDSHPVEAFRELAGKAADRRHVLAGSPDEADLVLFVDCHLLLQDPGLAALRRNPLLHEFRRRSLVYDERDLPWLAWPGVYVSMPRRELRREFQEPWAYYSVPDGLQVEVPPPPDLLFSFVGSLSHRVRRDVLALRDPRAVVEDVGLFVFFDNGAPGNRERRVHFQETLLRSKFVLCPRGAGTSSIRLYETLMAGRVPVVVADDWVAPDGPDWDRCSIRWPEDSVAELPRALAEREGDFDEMAAAARRAYEDWFAPDRSFQRIVDACERLLEREAPARFPARGVRGRAYVRARVAYSRWRLRACVVRAVRALRFAGRPPRR